MKKISIVFFAVLLFSACNKEDETIAVQYKASNGFSNTQIKYRDAEGVLVSENIDFEGGEDVWTYSFDGKKGDIVFVSARCYDSISSITLQILLDGKVFKEGTSNNETDEILTVSGTIPYYNE